MKKTPIKRKKRLNPVSKKRKKVNKEYMELRDAYLASHPYCEWWLAEHGITMEQAIVRNGFVKVNGRVQSVPLATEIHHRRGRGKYLLDASTWIAVSSEGHRAIHNYPQEAYAKGYLLPRNG